MQSHRPSVDVPSVYSQEPSAGGGGRAGVVVSREPSYVENGTGGNEYAR